MPRVVFALLIVFASAFANAAAAETDVAVPGTETAAEAVPDSRSLERALQQLSWPQFRAVVEAIPKLKADVEAYGELGWQIVRANYMHYGWKRNIDRLDDAQKRELAALIAKARLGG